MGGKEVGFGLGVAVGGTAVAVAFAVVVLPAVLVGLAAQAARISAPHTSALVRINVCLVFIALFLQLVLTALPGAALRAAGAA